MNDLNNKHRYKLIKTNVTDTYPLVAKKHWKNPLIDQFEIMINKFEKTDE